VKRERNSFLTPLDVRVQPSGKTFKLLYPFTYRYRRLGRKFTLTVPAGFETDFASIPQPFHVIISKLGRHNKAAVIHDAIYQGAHKLQSSLGYPMVFTRRQADLIFLDGMEDLGVPVWKRYVMYFGVRLGGFFSWRKR